MVRLISLPYQARLTSPSSDRGVQVELALGPFSVFHSFTFRDSSRPPTLLLYQTYTSDSNICGSFYDFVWMSSFRLLYRGSQHNNCFAKTNEGYRLRAGQTGQTGQGQGDAELGRRHCKSALGRVNSAHFLGR